MSTKISALPAAAGAGIDFDDTSIFPLVDALTTTVKVTIAQLRTQLSNAAQVFTNSVTIPNAVYYRVKDSGGTSQGVVTISAGNIVQLGDSTGSYPLEIYGTTIKVKSPLTIPSTVTSIAGSGTDVVFGATTQATIGVNGAASALTANPLGYLVFYKGTTKCVLPYYNG
jgi:hypothetical protein